MAAPKFTVLYEKLRGKTFEIDRESMSIGRRDGVDICIKDSTLSGHHADIIRSERDGKTVYVLRDNDSTNGTRVNNVQITEQVLKNADLILFGAVEILFDSGEEDGEEISSSYQPTVTIDLPLDSSLSSAPTLTNLNPQAADEARKHEMVHKLMIAAVIVACLALTALVVYVLIKLFAF